MDQKVAIRIDSRRGTKKGLRKDNLGNEAEEHKGWFMERGVIVNRCNGDSYLVREESGRLAKRRHYDLKGLGIDIDETPSGKGDVIKGLLKHENNVESQ
jgi:hypothetical protein